VQEVDYLAYSQETNDSVEFALELMRGLELPPQPTIIAAISKEMAKSEPSFQTISTLVTQDPALASHVLKLINSPLFSLQRKITSIQTALSLLGLKKFYSMVITSAAKIALGFNTKNVEELWEHSLLVAKSCELIALGIPGGKLISEEAYMVGLFHDSAIPVLLLKHPSYLAVVEKVVSLGGEIQSFEEEHFNTHHALVGSLLCRSWGLPSHIYKVIRFHHGNTLDIFDDVKTKRLAAVLVLADFLARCAANSQETEDCHSQRWLVLLEQIQKTLDINLDKIDEFKTQAERLTILEVD